MMSSKSKDKKGKKYRSSPKKGDEETALWLRDDNEKFFDEDNILEDYPDTIDDIKARLRAQFQLVLAMILLFCAVAIPLIVTKVGLRGEKAPHKGAVVVSEDDDITALKPPLTDKVVVDILAGYGISQDRSLLQELAFDWLMADHALSSYSDARIAHRFALACFYYSTYEVNTIRSPDAPKWAQKDNWMTTKNECDWFGITCESNHEVTKMELPHNNITGFIPTELGIFHNTLRVLDVSNNMLYMNHEEGHFDVFEQLTNLEELDMHNNFLACNIGPPLEVAQLTKLTSLDLSFNLLKGFLHLEYFVGMTELQHLQLQGNFLTGHLDPEKVRKLTHLHSLDVRDNKLKTGLHMLKHGADLSSLSKLWIEKNKLTGRIPTEIESMTALTSLSLMNGTIIGPIPSEIGLLTNLERLWLGGNMLSGGIPEEMKQLTRLEVLELQQNDLSGEVPAILCQSLNASTYEFKKFAADCEEDVTCECCTECF